MRILLAIIIGVTFVLVPEHRIGVILWGLIAIVMYKEQPAN